MKIFLVIFLSIMIFPVFAPSHPEYVGVDPPKKQVTKGVAAEHVICREGLVLIIKYNGSPACVRHETAVKLEDRGWGGMDPPCCKPTEVSSIDSFEECVAAGNPVMESYPRQCRTIDGKHFVEVISDTNNEKLQTMGKETILELNSPNSLEYNGGQPVVFAGTLWDQFGERIPYVEIIIKTDGPCPSDQIITRGITDKYGKFWIVEEAVIWDETDNMIVVHAEFEGNEEFLPSISPTKTVVVYPQNAKKCEI